MAGAGQPTLPLSCRRGNFSLVCALSESVSGKLIGSGMGPHRGLPGGVTKFGEFAREGSTRPSWGPGSPELGKLPS